MNLSVNRKSKPDY